MVLWHRLAPSPADRARAMRAARSRVAKLPDSPQLPLGGGSLCGRNDPKWKRGVTYSYSCSPCCNSMPHLCHVRYYPTPRHTRSGGCSAGTGGTAEAPALEGRGGGSKGLRRGWSRTAVPSQVCKQGCQPTAPQAGPRKRRICSHSFEKGKSSCGFGQ